MAKSKPKNLNDKVKQAVIEEPKKVLKKLKAAEKPAPKKPGRKEVDINSYLAEIERYLMLGYSLNRACELGGVPRKTLTDHMDRDEQFRRKVDLLMNSVSIKARANVIERINNKDYHASVDWLERKEKDEWSKRQELTGENGQPIQQEIIVTIKDTHADKLRDKPATQAARGSGHKQ